jgi:predicted nuclease of predicted toxin-antitoxin system
MRPLLDNNLSHRLVARLQDMWPQIAHVRAFGYSSASDSGVWELAKENGLCIVTRDADFQQLSRLHGHPPKVVWLAVPDRSTAGYESLLRKHHPAIDAFGLDDAASLLVIAEDSVLKLVTSDEG